MLRAVAWLATRDTQACVWENKDTSLEVARLSPFLPFGLVLAFQAWLWPFWPVFGFSDTLYNLTICEKDVTVVFIYRTVKMVYKRVCRNCPKYLVRLANHLADVHQLDHIRRKQYLREAKLQPEVKVVVYESEADNSGKNHSTSTRSPVQTQETVYKLSRSRKNGVSFKEKAKRTTTKNKTNRKKQTKKKSNSWLRGYRKIV